MQLVRFRAWLAAAALGSAGLVAVACGGDCVSPAAFTTTLAGASDNPCVPKARQWTYNFSAGWYAMDPVLITARLGATGVAPNRGNYFSSRTHSWNKSFWGNPQLSVDLTVQRGGETRLGERARSVCKLSVQDETGKTIRTALPLRGSTGSPTLAHCRITF